MAKYDRSTQSGDLTGAIERARKHRVKSVPMSGGAKAMLAGLGLMAAAGGYALLHSNEAEQAPEVEYVAGQFVAKFENEIALDYGTDGNVITGLDEIDALNDELSGEVYEQYVAHSEEHELDNIYIITVGEDVDLEELMEDFAASPDVEYVEQSFLLTPDFEVPELTAEELQAFEEMLKTEPNDHYYPLDVDDLWDSPFGNHKALWGLHNTDAAGAWDTVTGLPEIIAAVIDTGVDYNHVDIAGRILRDEEGNIIGYDFVNKDNDPMDDHGHGTHVSGTIAAETDNEIGIAGVTWNGKIMPLKVCGKTGGCDWTDVGRALVFAADNGAHVANISLGAKRATPKALAEAIEYADSQGLIILTSAGNYNDNTKNWTPANHPYVLSIAATTPDDEKATFSNHGEIVDVGAPGEQILSLLAKDHNVRGAPVVGEIYTVFRGTSMACPHAVGNVMLILSANPELIGNREAVQAVLRAGVYDYAKEPRNPVGTGIISYAEAVKEAKKYDVEAGDVPPHLERVMYLVENLPEDGHKLKYSPYFQVGEMSSFDGRLGILAARYTLLSTRVVAVVDGDSGVLDNEPIADGTIDLAIIGIKDREGMRVCQLYRDELRDLEETFDINYILSTDAWYRALTEGNKKVRSNFGKNEFQRFSDICDEDDRWMPIDPDSDMLDILQLTDE